MINKARCPYCNRLYVYSEHCDNRWRIFCMACGASTGWHDTHEKASKEWEGVSR